MTGDEHYKASEDWLTAATENDLPYERAVVYANVAQTHALLAQIATARELGAIQQAGIDAFKAADVETSKAGQLFCRRTQNCRLADGHADGCRP